MGVTVDKDQNVHELSPWSQFRQVYHRDLEMRMVWGVICAALWSTREFSRRTELFLSGSRKKSNHDRFDFLVHDRFMAQSSCSLPASIPDRGALVEDCHNTIPRTKWLNQQKCINIFSPLEAESPTSRCQPRWFLPRSLSVACLTAGHLLAVSSRGLPSTCTALPSVSACPNPLFP